MHERAYTGTIERESEPVVRLLNVEDTMSALGKVSKRYVYILIERGEIVSLMQGKRRMITLASIDAYIERQIAQASKSPAA
jgi:excisionase family DNA binding protein